MVNSILWSQMALVKLNGPQIKTKSHESGNRIDRELRKDDSDGGREDRMGGGEPELLYTCLKYWEKVRKWKFL